MAEKMRFVVATNKGHDVHILAGCQSAGVDIEELADTPSDGRFVYVVPVLDYWRLSRARCMQNEVAHYSDLVSRETIAAVNSRGVLVFDLSNEGHSFDGELFAELDSWLRETGLEPGVVAFVQQNRCLGAQAKVSGLQYVGAITFFIADFYVIKALLYNRYKHSANNTDNDSVKHKRFLCYNYAPRLHRILLITYLLDNGLLDKFMISFAGLSTFDKGLFAVNQLKVIKSEVIREAVSRSFDNLVTMGPVALDDVARGGNSLAFTINPSHYDHTWMSLVSETDFSNGAIQRITEKIIKPLSAGHPFIVLGNPNSLALIREIGFQTFHPLIREDYDRIGDWELRFIVACDEIGRLSSLDDDHFETLAQDLSEVCKFNRRHAADGAVSRYNQVYFTPFVKWANGVVQS